MNRQKMSVKIELLKRKWYIRNWVKKFILSSLNSNKVSFIEKEKLNFFKTKFSFFSNKTRHCNKCLVSGRNHNIFNKVRLSRFVLRDSLKKKNLAKVKKF